MAEFSIKQIDSESRSFDWKRSKCASFHLRLRCGAFPFVAEFRVLESGSEWKVGNYVNKRH